MTDTDTAPTAASTKHTDAIDSDTSTTANDDIRQLSPLERRNSLEKALSRRPDPKDLKDRNILHDSSAMPSIQQQKQKLEHAMVADNLKKGLSQRPEKDDLRERMLIFLVYSVVMRFRILPVLENQQLHTQDCSRLKNSDGVSKIYELTL